MLSGSGGFLETQGYFYPRLPEPKSSRSHVWTSPFRHNCIAASYADFNSVFETLTETEKQAFWDAIPDSGLVPILSAEEFSRQNDFTPLASAMSRLEIEVVLYLRRQDLYLESLYNQRNKILVGRERADFLNDDFLTEKELLWFTRVSGYDAILDYENLLSRIMVQMNPASIRVRNFNRSALVGNDVCKDFCHVLGIDHNRMNLPKINANQSISNQCLLELKRTFDSEGERAAVAMMKRVNTGDLDTSGSYRVLTESTRSEILRRYEDVNKSLRDIFLVDLFRDAV